MPELQPWQKLAQNLSGSYCEEQWSEEPLDVVYGDLDGLAYTVLQPYSGELSVRLDYPDGQDRDAVARSVFNDTAFRAAVAAAHGCDPRLAEVDVSEARLVVTWRPHQGRPDVEGLGSAVKAMAAAIARIVPERSLSCTICAEPKAKVCRWESSTVRICSVCLDCKQKELKGLRAISSVSRSSGTDEEEEPTLSLPEGLTPYALDEMSRGLKSDFERNPKVYRLKLLAFVLLGQTVLSVGILGLMGILLLFVGACGYALALGQVGLAKLAQLLLYGGIPFALAAGTAGTALTVLGRNVRRHLKRSDPDDVGERLDRKSAPRLFDWLDELGRELSAPVPDVVLLTSGSEAGVGERRVGWRKYESRMRLGIVVLETFEPEELRAIISHELGHLHQGDSRKRWIFRTAATWQRLAAKLRTNDGDSYLERFANWYLPRFLVRARVEGRADEYRADRRAASLCGAEICAHSLVKSVLLDELFMVALWSAVRDRSLLGRTSAADSLELFHEGLRSVSPAKRERALDRALTEPSLWYDTHPKPAERLQQIGAVAPPSSAITFEPKSTLCDLIDDYAQKRAKLAAPLSQAASLKLLSLQRSLLGAQRRLKEEPVASTPDGWIRRAQDLQGLNQQDAALEALGQALSLDPTNAIAAKGRLSILLSLDRVEEAAAGWQALMAANPEDVQTLYEAAEFFRQCAMPVGEAACLHRLLNLGPPPEIRSGLEYRLSRLAPTEAPLGPVG